MTIHFAFGMVVGTLISLPLARRAWCRYRALHRVLGAWILLAWAGGIWAALPSVMRHLGLPVQLAAHPLMNVFLFHPLIGRLIDGGRLIGSGLLVLELGTMYLALLIAIIYRRRQV